MTDWRVRLEPAAADVAFIVRTWLNSYRHDSVAARAEWQRRPWVCESVYAPWQAGLVRRLLVGGDVRLVDDPVRPETIIGWAARGWSEAEPGLGRKVAVVHYCYVRPGWRRMGVGRALCAGLAGTWYYTHRTGMGDAALAGSASGMAAGALYNPWAVSGG